MSSTLAKPLLVLLAVTLALAACGDSDDASAGGDTATPTTADASTPTETPNGDTLFDPDPDPDPDSDSDSDPEPVLQVDDETIGQIGAIFVRDPLTDEEVTCLREAAEADPNLAVALTVVAGRSQPVSEGHFTVLVEAVRDCVGQSTVNEALAIAFAFGSDPEQFNSCLDGKLVGDAADPATAALTGVAVRFGLEGEMADVAVDVLSECVSDELLANQVAVTYESRQGFSVLVDQGCLVGHVSAGAASSFWETTVASNSFDALDELEDELAGCAESYYEDLLQSVPDDFEPWSGNGDLAGVAPPARADVYDAAPPMMIDPSRSYSAVIETVDGEMRFELFADTAPNTVNSFVALARDGYYDRTVFHRVLVDFMAQGGDPTATGSGGPGYTFPDETEQRPELDSRGLLAMANSGPDTNGSQFFITLVPTEWLNGSHTVFGSLVEGDDVLASIDLRDPEAPTSRGEEIIAIRIVEEQG
jgi:cyclophilin family peptidyl-prolyl cis-trans isomerase